MATLRLRIAAPMQSWGTRSRFTERDTTNEPSKSGVIGILCAALGRPRHAQLDDLVALRFGVRIDQPGRFERDYHTANGVPNTEGKSPSTVVSNRYYLADAAFLVGLEGDPALLHKLHEAIEAPQWPLYLGRKAFPPTPPVTLGIADTDLDTVLRTQPWLIRTARDLTMARQQLERGAPLQLTTVTDTDPPGHDRRSDVPLSFDTRTFATRAVAYSQVPLTEALLSAEEPTHA